MFGTLPRCAPTRVYNSRMSPSTCSLLSFVSLLMRAFYGNEKAPLRAGLSRRAASPAREPAPHLLFFLFVDFALLDDFGLGRRRRSIHGSHFFGNRFHLGVRDTD